MRKFTRRSYNRKLIVFGISLLAAVGLISTGFSAWIMSAVTNVEDAGKDNVNVGIIQDASVVVTVDQWKDNTWTPLEGEQLLSFDAPKDDDGGRLRGNGTDDQNLEMVISGKVQNGNILTTNDSLTMRIKLPEGLKNAISQEYIELLDANYYSDGVITVPREKLNYTDTTPDNDNENTYQFSYTLEFKWGSYFAGANPAVFYDSDTLKCMRGQDGAEISGKNISPDQMKSEVEAFRNCMVNGEAELTAQYKGTILITVTATVD